MLLTTDSAGKLKGIELKKINAKEGSTCHLVWYNVGHNQIKWRGRRAAGIRVDCFHPRH